MGRAPCCDKANMKKGPWSPEEDVRLKTYIEEHGTGSNWIALPQKIGLKRCGKSCRLRWLNYLRPDIRHGGFSEEEDQTICSLYISIGSRWSIIAAQLPGRTDNDIKNYWNTRLKKKLLGRRKDTRRGHSLGHESSSPNRSDHDSPNSQTLSSMALERMQLHLQLQGLQNPFSLYNNPALWPAFNPLFQYQQVGATMNRDRDESSVPLVSDTTIMYPSMGANMQEEIFRGSNLNGVGGGIPAEQLQITELDWFEGMVTAKENVNWWSTTNCFDEKSSSASSLQTDSIIHEYVLGYDL